MLIMIILNVRHALVDRQR